MIEFKFKKAYEEIMINDQLYTIDFSDEAIMGYQKKFNEFYQKYQALQTKEEQDTEFTEAKELMSEVVNAILGENKFDILYLESGKSLYNMMDLVEVLSGLIGDKVENIREKNRQKYVGK